MRRPASRFPRVPTDGLLFPHARQVPRIRRKGRPHLVRRHLEGTEAADHQIALAWLLHRSPVMLPIPGTSSREHFEENLAAATIHLTAEEVNAITQLLPEDKEARDSTNRGTSL